jgi:hypothetical protein
MIEHKLWDHTMFLHHDNTDHVIAAAPVDYIDHHIKYSQFGQLGWNSIGFPEYSAAYPHEKYTIAFADKGPSFYINTLNNTEHHGPGTQSHYELPFDADSCFATVVEGLDTIDALEMYGTTHNPITGESSNPYASEGHFWTHIVSAELLVS